MHSQNPAFQTPSFLEDTVSLDKTTAISLFRGKLVNLLNSLSARRHCRFVSELSSKIGLSIPRTQDLLNKLIKHDTTQKKTKKRTCRYWHTKITKIKKLFHIPNSKSKSNRDQRMRIIHQELPKLYNNLPLPFQCEILFEVGRLSAMDGFELSENSVNYVTKMNLYEVGNIIKKSEKVVSSQVAMVRVADRCVKVLAGQKYRTTDIVISVPIGNQPLQKWERNLREKMPWICGKFSLDKGIKMENLHNFTVKKNLPFSAYFTHVLNSSVVGSRYEVKFHMHLIQANSMALEARFVLSALNAVSRKDLEMVLQTRDIKYWSVDHFIGTAVQSMNSYNLKMLFPTYLRGFFNLALKRHERCLIIHLVSKYSNSSTEKVTDFLKRKRVDVKFPCSIVNGVMSVVISPKRNRENELNSRKFETSTRKTAAPTLVIQPFWPAPKKEIKSKSTNTEIVHYKKATLVEIVMLVLLGAVAVVFVVFTFTCVLFIVRKRRFKKQQIKHRAGNISESTNGDQDIVVDASKLSDDELRVELNMLKWKGEKLSRPVYWSQRHQNGDKLIGVTLEPLRISTDDEESRCGEDEASVVRACEEHSGLFFLGKTNDNSSNHQSRDYDCDQSYSEAHVVVHEVDCSEKKVDCQDDCIHSDKNQEKSKLDKTEKSNCVSEMKEKNMKCENKEKSIWEVKEQTSSNENKTEKIVENKKPALHNSCNSSNIKRNLLSSYKKTLSNKTLTNGLRGSSDDVILEPNCEDRTSEYSNVEGCAKIECSSLEAGICSGLVQVGSRQTDV